MREKVFVTKAVLPDFEEYVNSIKPLWDSHCITNMGTYHNLLEERLKYYLGASNLSLTVNGHMALELVIQAMNFPEGSEIITTPFTFISTTHAIIRNHLKPVFCDIKVDDFTIDPEKIEELITEKTVAIVPVHVYGNICNIEFIEQIAYKFGLKVIYDAAHAFAERYMGRGIAEYGDASVFSFHATKVFNTIEGGAVCFRDDTLYEKLYNLKNFGIRGEELVVSIGANAKMNEFAAIMGLCNLKNVDWEISQRKRIITRYKENLNELEGIEFNSLKNDRIERNYAYLPIICNTEKVQLTRDELYDVLRENGIYARKYFYPLTCEQACFKNMYVNLNLPVAKKVSKQILVLPVYGELQDEKVDDICDIIQTAYLNAQSR